MKTLPPRRLATLAVSFVGYNAASLVSLNVNTVGFYQISKISVTPTVMYVVCRGGVLHIPMVCLLP